jgi:Co/Zn/Cd efflux system component
LQTGFYGCEVLMRQVYVLKIWRDTRGDVHASLKDAVQNQTQHFPNLEAVVDYLKAQLKPVTLEFETQSEQ